MSIALIRAILCRPIAYHPALKRLTGSVNAALMLSQAIYWQGQKGSGVWFWIDADEWETQTGVTYECQKTARQKLVKHPFWNEKLIGIPAKMHYMLDEEILYRELVSFCENEAENTPNKFGQIPRTGTGKSLELVQGNPSNLFAEKPRTHIGTKTTTETTTETTHRKGGVASENSFFPKNQKKQDPPVPAAAPEIEKPQEVQALEYLDGLLDTKFATTPGNTAPVSYAIERGYTLQQIMLVFEHKCTEWAHEEMKRQWLKPYTMLAADKIGANVVMAEDWEKRAKPVPRGSRMVTIARTSEPEPF